MIRLPIATAVLYLVLIQPNHPAAMTWGALALFPLELPPLLAGLMLTGNRLAGHALRTVLVLGLALIALLKLADYGTFIAFNRGFNLAADLNLVAAGWMLAQSTFGPVLSWAALIPATSVLVSFAFALWWAMGQWAALPAAGFRPILAVVLVTTTALAIAEIGRARGAWTLPEALQAMLPGAAFTARVGLERAEQFGQTRADIRAFTTAARTDPMQDAGPFFAALSGRDHDRVRDQFRQAVDYSLRTIGAWAARHAEAAPLMVVLGDHEPARFVSGNDGFDVPIHIIGPPDLVERFACLGWTEGLIPDPATPARRMDSLRDIFLTLLASR